MKAPQKIFFDKASDVPNSSLPVLLFRGVIEPDARGKSALFRRTFKKQGWVGIWTDSIYDYTHFHSNAHEALGIAEGRVTVRLGGDEGRRVRLKAGDLLILPAGVGHRRIGNEEGLQVIGAYPEGQADYDLKRKGHAVPRVPLPRTDPFFGEDGPLVRAWKE